MQQRVPFWGALKQTSPLHSQRGQRMRMWNMKELGAEPFPFLRNFPFLALAGKEIIAAPYLRDPDQIFLQGNETITASCKAAVRQELPAAVQEANPEDLNGWSVSVFWKGGGTDYVWDAVEDELRTPSIMVQYRMENAPRTYEAGELSFTIPGTENPDAIKCSRQRLQRKRRFRMGSDLRFTYRYLYILQ